MTPSANVAEASALPLSFRLTVQARRQRPLCRRVMYVGGSGVSFRGLTETSRALFMSDISLINLGKFSRKFFGVRCRVCTRRGGTGTLSSILFNFMYYPQLSQASIQRSQTGVKVRAHTLRLHKYLFMLLPRLMLVEFAGDFDRQCEKCADKHDSCSDFKYEGIRANF